MHHFEAHELADSWELRAGLLDADPADASISACLRECAAALRAAAVPDVQPKGTGTPALYLSSEQVQGVIEGKVGASYLPFRREREGLFTVPVHLATRHDVPAAPMTAQRAVYFMERFRHEEKLLGPNEQAALDFVIAMLEAGQAPAPGAVQLPSPITEDMHVAACKVLTRAHGLDGLPQRMLDAMRAAAPSQCAAVPHRKERTEALEEAAKLCDARALADYEQCHDKGSNAAGDRSIGAFRCAAAIRALAAAHPPVQGSEQ